MWKLLTNAVKYKNITSEYQNFNCCVSWTKSELFSKLKGRFQVFFGGRYFRLGIYRLLNRSFKFFGNIRSYAIDFTIFHSYLNRIKTWNIIYPHFGPQPQSYSPSIIPVILYWLNWSYLIKWKHLGENSIAKFDPKTVFINRRCQRCKWCKNKQN